MFVELIFFFSCFCLIHYLHLIGDKNQHIDLSIKFYRQISLYFMVSDPTTVPAVGFFFCHLLPPRRGEVTETSRTKDRKPVPFKQFLSFFLRDCNPQLMNPDPCLDHTGKLCYQARKMLSYWGNLHPPLNGASPFNPSSSHELPQYYKIFTCC